MKSAINSQICFTESRTKKILSETVFRLGLKLKVLFVVLFFFCLNEGSAQTACATTVWQNGTQYCAGQQVTFGGSNYTNCFCTSSTQPNTSFDEAATNPNCQGTGRYWRRDGACTSCTNPSVPGSPSTTNITCTGFTANWTASTNSPTGYLLIQLTCVISGIKYCFLDK